jgi:hypothetical protein
VFPYQLRRRWGLKTIQLSPFTTYGGPWLNYPQDADFKAVSRLSFEKKVMGALIRQLPQVFYFKLNFRPEVTNWLPFYWENFQQTTRYTYVFENTESLEKITQGFRHTLRSDLKKAEKWVESRRDDEAWATVFDLNTQSLKRKNHRQNNRLKVFESLHQALQQRGQSASFIAYDRVSGQPSAGLYLVFDQRQAAILLTGTATAFKYQCAIYSLMLEALKFCSARKLSLDFEGSMDEGIEHSFRAFRGKLVPYSQVNKKMWSMWSM